MQNYYFQTGFPICNWIGWLHKTDSPTQKTIGWTDVCVVNEIKLTVLFKHSHICESLDE